MAQFTVRINGVLVSVRPAVLSGMVTKTSGHLRSWIMIILSATITSLVIPSTVQRRGATVCRHQLSTIGKTVNALVNLRSETKIARDGSNWLCNTNKKSG